MTSGCMCAWFRVATMVAWGATIAPRAVAQHPFAARVVHYAPAPGQFVNDSTFNDPARALGPPEGAGTSDGNAAHVVTLGGFGGSITLAFDHTVEDHQLNAWGLDAIVFGNAFWFGGDPQAHWAECATIEIALDANGNGLADDPWFLIPGSHLPTPPAVQTEQLWDDDFADATHPPELASWLPPGQSGQWSTAAWSLPAATFASVVITNPAGGAAEGIFGYADYSPTLLLGDLDGDDIVDDPTIHAEDFYTVPDDPFVVGVSPASGGGDAFDIAWAIDPVSGAPAQLPGFDFIRITNAVHAVHGPLGEKSPEIDAVSDAAIDPLGDYDADEDVDLDDVARLQRCFGEESALTPCRIFDADANLGLDLLDAAAVFARMTGPLP